MQRFAILLQTFPAFVFPIVRDATPSNWKHHKTLIKITTTPVYRLYSNVSSMHYTNLYTGASFFTSSLSFCSLRISTFLTKTRIVPLSAFNSNSLGSLYHVLLCVLYQSEAGGGPDRGACWTSLPRQKSSRNNEIAMLKMCCLQSVRTHYECTENSSDYFFCLFVFFVSWSEFCSCTGLFSIFIATAKRYTVEFLCTGRMIKGDLCS